MLPRSESGIVAGVASTSLDYPLSTLWKGKDKVRLARLGGTLEARQYTLYSSSLILVSSTILLLQPDWANIYECSKPLPCLVPYLLSLHLRKWRSTAQN